MSTGKGLPKGVQDMLNLPHLDDIMKEQGIVPEEPPMHEDEETNSAMAMVEVFEENLKTVGGEDHAKHLDVVSKETLDHARTVMDLAFNVDDRSRRGMIEQAANMYKTSIDAKNSKRDYELKLLKILQDQRKLEFEERKWRESRGEEVASSSEVVGEKPVMVDRNELIRQAIEDKKGASPDQ